MSQSTAFPVISDFYICSLPKILLKWSPAPLNRRLWDRIYDSTYVWGKSGYQEAIMVNRVAISIRKNVRSALYQPQDDSEVRTLLIDAICMCLDRHRTKCFGKLRSRPLFSEGFRFASRRLAGCKAFKTDQFRFPSRSSATTAAAGVRISRSLMPVPHMIIQFILIFEDPIMAHAYIVASTLMVIELTSWAKLSLMIAELANRVVGPLMLLQISTIP